MKKKYSMVFEGCTGIYSDDSKHEEMDQYGKLNGLTVTFAAWHPNPEYRIFETGSLLSKNDLYPSGYPSGLVIVDDKGNPKYWK
jgi:hypothetical protein